VGPGNEMYANAVAYLQVKAIGSPGTTLWLVANGVFRGLGDTITPLKWALAFTAMNAVMDPIFIFTLGYGCPGAAMGTVVAQYLALAPLLLKLRGEVGLNFDLKELADSFKVYLSSGSLVLVRTVGKILTYTVCAREAALLGVAAAAAYNVCFQLGTATTQICESISVAAQSLLARELAGRDPERVKAAAAHIIKRALLLGGLTAGALSFVTWLNQASVLASLAADPAIRALAASIMPLVLWTQLVKGFAYPVNGMTMGALDWRFLSISMWVSNAVCMAAILFFKPRQTIFTIWIALCLFMSTQMVTGLARILLGAGPWKKVRAAAGPAS